MWLCLNDAFVSAVQDPHRRDWLMVRARKRAHLSRLLPGRKITETRLRDYRFRAFVPKATFGEIVAERVLSINYGNFKDSVKDDALHDLYSRFWQLHHAYQAEPAARKRTAALAAFAEFDEKRDRIRPKRG